MHVEFGFVYDFGNNFGVNAHYGYQYVKNGKDAGLKDDSVSDYKVGVTKDLSGWLLGLSVVGTSEKSYFTTANGRDGGKTGVVLSVAKTF
ncbi:MAG: hypothetical protein ACEQSL_03825 [Sediminibacterium sp.]